MMLNQRDDEFQDYPIGLANSEKCFDCSMVLAGALPVFDAEVEELVGGMLLRMRSGAVDALPLVLRDRSNGTRHALSLRECGPDAPGQLRVVVLLDGKQGTEFEFPTPLQGVGRHEHPDAGAQQRLNHWLRDGENRRSLERHGLTMSGFCNWLWWTAKHPSF